MVTLVKFAATVVGATMLVAGCGDSLGSDGNAAPSPTEEFTAEPSTTADPAYNSALTKAASKKALLTPDQVAVAYDDNNYTWEITPWEKKEVTAQPMNCRILVQPIDSSNTMAEQDMEDAAGREFSQRIVSYPDDALARVQLLQQLLKQCKNFSVVKNGVRYQVSGEKLPVKPHGDLAVAAQFVLKSNARPDMVFNMVNVAMGKSAVSLMLGSTEKISEQTRNKVTDAAINHLDKVVLGR